MSVKVEKLEKNMAKLTIEVGADEVEKALQQSYLKQKNQIAVPGFRKGKVPRQMIEKMYGPEIFYQDAINIMIPDAYDNAVEECGEDIVSSPEIDVVSIKKGEPFVFTAEVALKPPVELGKYKGVSIDKVDITVSDEDVDKAIEKERENNARNIEVTDRPVKDKDMVILDFEGFVDGVAFEGGKGENHPLTIGSGAFIPGFEDQLIGAKMGEECEVKVKFPDDYQAKELASKDAVFKCTVKEIKEKELPALDDEFASEVSEFETLDEYKADVRKNLEVAKEKEAKDEKESKVIEAIVNDSKMDIPEAMITTQQNQMVDEFAQRMSMQGLSMEQYYQFTGASRERLFEQVRPQAEQRIKARLVLEAIAKAENITATDEDVEEELKTMADVYQMELEKVKEMMPEKSLEGIREDIVVKKAAEFAVNNAKEK
ncbi:MAG: trigger factor [Lachnospiraceae bacterium]|nr:trigger factor [Lachnospiraceae bacterium]